MEDRTVKYNGVGGGVLVREGRVNEEIKVREYG
jgi:hypothetical protein